MRRSANSTGELLCPFAKAVLNENALYMVFHREANGKSTELVESMALGYREPFKKAKLFHPAERRKKTLLIVFQKFHRKRPKCCTWLTARDSKSRTSLRSVKS